MSANFKISCPVCPICPNTGNSGQTGQAGRLFWNFSVKKINTIKTTLIMQRLFQGVLVTEK